MAKRKRSKLYTWLVEVPTWLLTTILMALVGTVVTFALMTLVVTVQIIFSLTLPLVPITAMTGIVVMAGLIVLCVRNYRAYVRKLAMSLVSTEKAQSEPQQPAAGQEPAK